MGRRRRVITTSTGETVALGRELGKLCLPNTIICLFGELGAGKTTLTKGIVEGATGECCAHTVRSPTFTYLNIYGRVYHFDLYRLQTADEFLSLGFEEYFYSGGLCCIEWSERIKTLLPPNRVAVTLSHVGEYEREIVYEIPESQICHHSR